MPSVSAHACPQVRLADFGLAHSDDDPSSSSAAAATAAATGRHCLTPPSVTPRTPHTPRHLQMPPAMPSGYTTPSLPRSLADLTPREEAAATHAAPRRAADAADAFRAGPRQYRLPTNDAVPVWDDVPSDTRPAGPPPPLLLPQSPERRCTTGRRAHASPVTEEKPRRPQRSNLDDEICYQLPPALALAAAAQMSPSAAARAPAAAAAAHPAPRTARVGPFGPPELDRPFGHEGRRFGQEMALEWAQLPTAGGVPPIRGTPEFVDPLYVHLLRGQASCLRACAHWTPRLSLSLALSRSLSLSLALACSRALALSRSLSLFLSLSRLLSRSLALSLARSHTHVAFLT